MATSAESEPPPAAVVLALQALGTPRPPSSAPVEAVAQFKDFHNLPQQGKDMVLQHGHRLLFIKWVYQRRGGRYLSKRVELLGE